jgi:hypothetical protein
MMAIIRRLWKLEHATLFIDQDSVSDKIFPPLLIARTSLPPLPIPNTQSISWFPEPIQGIH